MTANSAFLIAQSPTLAGTLDGAAFMLSFGDALIIDAQPLRVTGGQGYLVQIDYER